MLIETGHPKDFPIIERQLRGLLEGRAPLKYLFVTHQETPHSGGLGRVLRGRALVERQYKMFDDVLARLDQGVVQPRYVDRDEVR